MPDMPTPPPEFTPVPLRARRDGWTPERQYAYVVALAEFGMAAGGAAVGMTGRALRLRRRPGAAPFNRLCAAAGTSPSDVTPASVCPAAARGDGMFSASRQAET